MFLDEVSGTGDVVLLVGFQVPLYLCELALVQELMGEILGLDLVIEFAVLGRGCEVQEELADAVMDGVGSQEVQVRNPCAGLLGQYLA